MALIKCPECNKEISDKASVCIHCGFPLDEYINTINTTPNICIIDGVPYDFSEFVQSVNSFFKHNPNPTTVDESNFGYILNKRIRKLTGIGDRAGANLSAKIIDSRSIPQKFNTQDYPEKPTIDINVVRCPKCGSTAITSGARGVNFTKGLIGASKTVNRCGNCGYTWQPKK